MTPVPRRRDFTMDRQKYVCREYGEKMKKKRTNLIFEGQWNK